MKSRLVQGERNYSIGSREIHIVNPSDASWTRHRYVLWFGAYGETLLLVWANSLDDALEEAGDWLESNEPGIFVDESVREAYEEEYAQAIVEGCDEEEACERAQEEAETDVTSVCSGRHYLTSWQWGITAENPTRADLLAIQGRTTWARGGRA